MWFSTKYETDVMTPIQEETMVQRRNGLPCSNRAAVHPRHQMKEDPSTGHNALAPDHPWANPRPGYLPLTCDPQILIFLSLRAMPQFSSGCTRSHLVKC